MKTFKQYISEMAPPPDDWDRNIFKKPYQKQIDYAMDRAAKIGSGSSRVAFEIEYEGRPTILKIAKNKKGLAQNEKEGDWAIYETYSSVTIPLIDIDEENDPPRWLHFEKADKLTYPAFKSIEGFSFDHFGDLLKDDEERRAGTGIHSSRPHPHAINWEANVPEEFRQEIWDSILFQEVTDLMSNYDIRAGDLTSLENWGIYGGQPVIIDLGLDSKIAKAHYSQKLRFW